ncbi:unnamed protein product [Psylliodes chrysocephalus]|uniref:GHMP kinase N-terminal domain-containing protein n=1 Tax=Psylliodes chrysocephalus TaxID=3402493 RepID=A0A9P0CZL2_9CUCU|nr:unnamed protein product [Psylliodes chrysocephala]
MLKLQKLSCQLQEKLFYTVNTRWYSVVYGKLALAASLGLRTKIILSEIDEPDAFEIVSQVLNHKFDLQEIKSVLLEPLPLLVDKKDFNWEYPNLLNHEELVRKIDCFLNASNSSLSNIHQVMSAKAILYLCAGIIGSTSTDLKPIEIRIITGLTTGAGMGSSASFSVCVAAALVQYVKSQRSVNSFSKHSFKPSHWNIDLDFFNAKELDLICHWSFCAEKIIHGTPSDVINPLVIQFFQNIY